MGSFRLHLAAAGKAPKTVRTYTEAVAWFAATHLSPRTSCTRWDQVSGHDVQRWLVHLLTRYSDAYASNQFRALQQFFRWLADEEQLPDPMARLRAPKVTEKLVPVFSSEELSALEKTCQGRTFAQRRDAAIIAVLTATGMFSGGSDPAELDVFDDSSRSAIDHNRIVTPHVLYDAACPKTAGVRAAATTSTTSTETCCKSSPRSIWRNVVRQAEDPWRRDPGRGTGRDPV
jgi:integrase/recombinase XerD